MAVSIVKIPQNVHADYDFVAFSFNGKHSYEDFGIVRVSEGSRYNENLSPTLADKTAEVPGGDGTYYFNTQHKQKVFNISFAFDGMSEAKLREMKQWLNGKDMADLWFAEAPYKVYTAKVTGTPQMKYVCFDQYNEETGKTERVYKGEGSVTFTAYWPYAHTPDFVTTTWDYVFVNGEDSPEDWSVACGVPIIGANEQWLESLDISGDLCLWIQNEMGDWVEDEVGLTCTWLVEEWSDDGPTGIFYPDTYEARLQQEGEPFYRLPSSSDKLINLDWLDLYIGNCYVRAYIGDSSGPKVRLVLAPTMKPKEEQVPGTQSVSYAEFSNNSQWLPASGLPNTAITCVGENPGDIPAPFVLSCDGAIESGTTFRVFDTSITITGKCYNLKWDSKTGMVTGTPTAEEKDRAPIAYEGESIGEIPIGEADAEKLQLNGGVLKYNYWYY